MQAVSRFWAWLGLFPGWIAVWVLSKRGNVWNPDSWLITGPDASRMCSAGWGGVTLSSRHVLIWSDPTEPWTVYELAECVAHEAVHTEQARKLGPLYIPVYLGILTWLAFRVRKQWPSWRTRLAAAYMVHPMELEADRLSSRPS